MASQLMITIKKFLAPIIKLFMSRAGRILAKAAFAAVAAVQASMAEADGSEKREAAFNAIKKELMAEGIDLAASSINLAIEAALQSLPKEE